MKTIVALAAVSVLALSVSRAPSPRSRRNGGAIAAGVVGGLAVGAIVGSQVNRNYYGGPAYVDQPAYVGRAADTAAATPNVRKSRTLRQHSRSPRSRLRLIVDIIC